MTPVKLARPHPGGQLIVFAKDQPEYGPLPASIDQSGLVMTEWELTADELDRVLQGGRIRLWVHTFRFPLQPVTIEVTEPPCGIRNT